MRDSQGGNRDGGKLVRALGPIDATMIAMGSMIGSGIFITSAESSRLIGAPGWLLLAWAVAGLLTITGALCCSELATMMPRAGGVYVFLREAYGSSVGFLYGWTLFLVIQTGTIAAVAIAFAKFLGVFVAAVNPDNYLLAPVSLGAGYAMSLSTEQLVAITLIVLLTWINTRGLEAGMLVQNTFTFAKTAALLGVIVVGLSLGWNSMSAARSAAWWNSWANGWSPQIAQPGFTFVGGFALVLLFGKSMVGPLFAQTAWTNVTFVGSEVQDPARNLSRALLYGCGSVVVLYFLANVAYVASLSWTTARANAWRSKSTPRSRACGCRAYSSASRIRAVCRNQSPSITGLNSTAKYSTNGPIAAAFTCRSFDQASRMKTRTSKASTGNSATNA